jgi:hypothetical protein
MSMIGSTWDDDCGSSTYAGMKGSPRHDALAAIAKDYLSSLNDRRGYRQLWDEIDKEIRGEITDELIEFLGKARAVP